GRYRRGMRRTSWGVIAFGCVATVVLPAAIADGPVAAAATVPTGFDDVAVRDGFSRPTTVEWLPTGELAVLEQGGRLRFVTPGGDATLKLDLDVCSNSERGLLGFAADPAFLANGRVYVYY